MRRHVLAAALAAFVLVWFSTLDYRRIIKADEGRYAEIAREMVASGDWLTPRLNGFKYFEKPALQHWTTAAAFTAFGVNEWTARLWTALTGFLGVLLVYWAGNRAFGRPVGLHSAAVLASSALWVFVGHFLSLDMGVAFFMTLAVLTFMVAQLGDTAPARRRNLMLAGWAAMALAVLSKGLIGVVLPVGAVAAYVLLQRDWRLLTRLHLLSGSLVFLGIAAPWFVAVSLENPEFFRFFFIYEHFERFLTTAHGRYEPPWYFIPVLAIGIMPWLPAAIPGVWFGWLDTSRGSIRGSLHPADGRGRQEEFRPARFLVVWSAVVLLFFSVSSSKLPSYVLPVVPAIALLAGRYLPHASRSLLVWQAALAAAAGVGAALLATRMESFASRNLPAELLLDYAPWIAAAGAALLAGAAAALVAARRGRLLASTLLLSAGGLAFMQLALTGHESLSPAYSAYHTVQRIRPYLETAMRTEPRIETRQDTRTDARIHGHENAPFDANFANVPFYFVNTFDHSLPFYLGRTVTMVAYMDELAIPIGWEPEKFLSDIDAFAAAWARDRRAFAVMAPADYERLRRRGDVPMQVIASDPRRIVVMK